MIVLDRLLPEQDGFAVLEQIRGRTSAPVIVLTARTEFEDRLKCSALGAVDFIAKPFFVEELVVAQGARLPARVKRSERAQGARAH